MKALAVITSYNRQERLNRLISDLLKEGFDIVVFDDVTANFKQIEDSRITYIINQEHRGKEGFWRTYQDIFDYCKEHVYEYYAILPDDIIICKDFLSTLVEKFNKIGCITLCPLLTNKVLQKKESRWGHKYIKVYDTYAKTSYFDCCGFMTRDFFEALNWTIKPVEKERFYDNPYISSGVGEQITKRLQEKNLMMCHCVPTMCSVGDLESMMNIEERKRTPLTAEIIDYKNSVDVYMASIWRDGFIVDTLKSIINQPEIHSINVSLNNYTDEQAEQVMSQCASKKIKWHRTNNEKCSNEKLRFVHEGTSKYVAFADDDLIYAPDHFKNLISKCEAWGGGVSMHGGLFKQIPIKSYYNGGRRVYKCLENLDQDVEVDILGNGAGLFKREWLSKDEWKALYDDATDVSMDDILVSCAMNKKDIHCYVIAHEKMQHKERLESDNYVAEKYLNDDSVQCEYINTNYHRIFIPYADGNTERERMIIRRYQKRYPTCDVWIEGKYLCLRKKGRTGTPTRYVL